MSNLEGCFDWASSFYDQTRKIPDDLLEKLVKSLINKIQIEPSSRILEVGVGTGRLIIPIARKLKRNMIIGVDLSKKMLVKCAEKGEKEKNVHLIVCDGFNLPFSQSFDLIFTSHVLHLIEDHFKFIKSLLQNLTSDGTYIDLEAYVRYQETEIFTIFYDKLKKGGYQRIMKAELVQKEIKVYFKRRGWIYDNINLSSKYEISIHNLVRFIRNRVFSHQRAIPDELYKGCLEYLYHEIETRNIDPFKKIKVPAIANITIFQRLS